MESLSQWGDGTDAMSNAAGDISVRSAPSPRFKVFRNPHATATIARGDWVQMIVAGPPTYPGFDVQTSAATANLNGIVGVAAEDIPPGQTGKVLVDGIAHGANVVTGTAAGVQLSTVATAGRAGLATGVGITQMIGTCLTLAAANKADVWVQCG